MFTAALAVALQLRALPQLQLNLKQMHSPNFAAETGRRSKWLQLLNESGRYKLFTLRYPDFAAVKWKRLLNGSSGNSAFYDKLLGLK